MHKDMLTVQLQVEKEADLAFLCAWRLSKPKESLCRIGIFIFFLVLLEDSVRRCHRKHLLAESQDESGGQALAYLILNVKLSNNAVLQHLNAQIYVRVLNKLSLHHVSCRMTVACHDSGRLYKAGHCIGELCVLSLDTSKDDDLTVVSHNLVRKRYEQNRVIGNAFRTQRGRPVKTDCLIREQVSYRELFVNVRHFAFYLT